MAAPSGYPIMVNGTPFPMALMAPEGYSNIPNRRQDKGSITDGKGITNRKILPARKTTIKIKTIDDLTFGQKLIVQAFFPNRDKVDLTYWNDEDNAYKTIECYVPDIEYVWSKCNESTGDVYYAALEFEYIDYGTV